MNANLNSSGQGIYRFINFDNFVDLIQRKALTFVTRDLLEDPYEGYVYGALKTSHGRQQILNVLREHYPQDAEAWLSILLNMDRCWYIQSWTRCTESDALWRIYSHNKHALRIEISLEDILKLNNVSAHDMQYKDNLTLRDEIESLISSDKKNLNPRSILLCKRSSFLHEQEIRLLSFERDNLATNYQTPEEQNMRRLILARLHDNGKMTDNEFETALKDANSPEKRLEKLKRIPFNHIENFIRSVMIHPLAPNWFSETINTFCNNNNIRYLGRSNLYTFTV